MNVEPSLLCRSPDAAASFVVEVSAAERSLCCWTTFPSKHHSLSAQHFTSEYYYYYDDYYYTHTQHTTILLLFWNMSGTTRVSSYQKGKTRKDKPIWIYWSKR